MQKIISLFLSVLMLILSIFGIGGTNNNMKTGDFLVAVATEFGYAEGEISAEDAAALLAEKGVIKSATVDLDAPVDAEYVLETLGKAGNIEVTATSEFIKEAVKAGLLKLKDGVINGFETTTDICMDLLELAKKYANNKDMGETESTVKYAEEVVEIESSDYAVSGNTVVLPAGTELAAGDVFTLPQTSENIEGGIYEAAKVTETAKGVVVKTSAVNAEDVIESIDFKGNVAPNMAAAQIVSGDGEVIQDGTVDNEGIKETIDEVKTVLSDKELLKDTAHDLIIDTISEGSFSVGGADVDYAFKDGGFDIGISGELGKGIKISKSYSVSDLALQTKFDGSFENGKTNIKEAYLKLNYDCVDTTRVDGSYQASLVSGLQEDISSLEIVDQVKTNFENLKLQSGTARFPVFTAHIAIPNAPAITIKLEASVIFNVYGYAELIITTSECVGYEIIDNNGRFIYESKETAPKVFNAMGTAEALVGLNVALCIASISLLDVGVQGGLGVYVYASATLPYDGDFVTTSIEDIPANLLAQAIAVTDNADEIEVKGTAQFYGVFKVALCEESISSKIGLSKTWTIVDRSNGTFYTYEF